jgi:putative FmdB family regulatory protein
MPIYEYSCNRCNAFNSVFLRSFSQPLDPCCSKCGSKDLRRLISRFAVAKSEDARLDSLSDPSQLGDVDESDPRSVARWARRMGREMGEEMGPEFDEMVDRMEAGQMPDDMEGEGLGAPDSELGSDEGEDLG